MLKLDSIKTLAVLGMYCLQIQKLHTYSPGTLLKLGARLFAWSIDNVSVFGGWNIPLSLSLSVSASDTTAVANISSFLPIAHLQ